MQKISMPQQKETYNSQHFTVISLSYEKADAFTRGRFAFFENHIAPFLALMNQRNLGDAFVLSTCNRTEIYATTNDPEGVAEVFCICLGVALQDFLPLVDIKTHHQAVAHLFRVAGGLESQILGDFEIISQIKKAYQNFKTYRKNSNALVEKAINTAIQISKRIKNETGISHGAASVAYAAVHYILNHPRVANIKNIMLLGVGEIGQNTLENLMKHLQGPAVKIANRNHEKAEKISKKYKIPQIDYADFKTELQHTDVLIVATAASHPIVFEADFGPRDILVLDLSMPPNVEPSAGLLPQVGLVNVDELSQQIAHTIAQRQKEIPKAEAILAEMTTDFNAWEQKRVVIPQIKNIKQHFELLQSLHSHSEDAEQHLLKKINNRFAKYLIEHPQQANDISLLMDEIMTVHLKTTTP
jgi:glutamyl-tRNA reductase